jgi:hypothetical protein
MGVWALVGREIRLDIDGFRRVCTEDGEALDMDDLSPAETGCEVTAYDSLLAGMFEEIGPRTR